MSSSLGAIVKKSVEKQRPVTPPPNQAEKRQPICEPDVEFWEKSRVGRLPLSITTTSGTFTGVIVRHGKYTVLLSQMNGQRILLFKALFAAARFVPEASPSPAP